MSRQLLKGGMDKRGEEVTLKGRVAEGRKAIGKEEGEATEKERALATEWAAKS